MGIKAFKRSNDFLTELIQSANCELRITKYELRNTNCKTTEINQKSDKDSSHAWTPASTKKQLPSPLDPTGFKVLTNFPSLLKIIFHFCLAFSIPIYNDSEGAGTTPYSLSLLVTLGDFFLIRIFWIGQAPPPLMKKMDKIGQNWSKIGQNWSKFGQNWSKIGQNI